MEIPAQAKIVFRGKIFDVYQWEQRMFDGSVETFEMIKRPGTIQIVPTIGDKILLSQEEQPTKPRSFTFLGGRQEEGEDALTGAKRELKEEAGLESQDWELIKTYNPETKIDWPIFLFVARNCIKVAEPNLDSGERIEVKEFDFADFINLASSEGFFGGHISDDLFRIKHDPKKLAEFKSLLFK